MKSANIVAVSAALWLAAGCFGGFGSDPIPPADGSIDGDEEGLDGEDTCPNGVLDEGEECDDKKAYGGRCHGAGIRGRGRFHFPRPHLRPDG